MKNIRFAFAISKETNLFEKRHFGETDNFLIYEYNLENKKIELISTEENKYKDIDETHGSSKKGNAIIQFLESFNVHALVSMQFGKNINMVNKHFVPIIVQKEKPEEVLVILSNHIRWFLDELSVVKEEYNVFKIDKGIIKHSIKLI